MSEFDDNDLSGALDSIVSNVSKDWLGNTPERYTAFDSRVTAALAGTDAAKLRSAIVSTIPSAKSSETTWDQPLPKNIQEYNGIRTGIAFVLAAYRHADFLGEEQVSSLIGQDAFYTTLIQKIGETSRPQANEPAQYPSNSILGKLLNGMKSLGSTGRGFDLEAAKHGIIATHKAIESMRQPRA